MRPASCYYCSKLDRRSQCLQLQEAVGGRCDRCHNADTRVQQVESELTTLESTLENERQISQSHQKYIDELESNLNTIASDVSVQVV